MTELIQEKESVRCVEDKRKEEEDTMGRGKYDTKRRKKKL